MSPDTFVEDITEILCPSDPHRLTELAAVRRGVALRQVWFAEDDLATLQGLLNKYVRFEDIAGDDDNRDVLRRFQAAVEVSLR